MLLLYHHIVNRTSATLKFYSIYILLFKTALPATANNLLSATTICATQHIICNLHQLIWFVQVSGTVTFKILTMAKEVFLNGEIAIPSAQAPSESREEIVSSSRNKFRRNRYLL